MDSPSSAPASGPPRPRANGSDLPGADSPAPQVALLNFIFPGFSSVSDIVLRYLGVDLNVYIPLFAIVAGLTFAWDYMRDYAWAVISNHFMSTVEVRVDDEIYNIVIGWVANQSFAKSSRRFVVNTNLSSRSWNVWKFEDEDDDDNDNEDASLDHKKKPLSYTPSFGTHTFWYKGSLLLFQRTQNKEQMRLSASEREEISISCLGRSPWVLKELLMEARLEYSKKDADNTLIYRGVCKGMSSEPTWQRCLSRASRPLSTVILSEAKKQRLLEDVADYLAPATRRWYSNRGIPYRRGYLLYGPPGTGKSSLSLALAGHFKMRIYIVSLSSLSASEENLSSLFADLPRRCMVLLEDIDAAGLTNTRETSAPIVEPDRNEGSTPDKPATQNSDPPGRLSLSALLNILDGVASQEGRLLVMTTNHLENLDKALIRPGRVDMTIEFNRADSEIAASIFTAIYTRMEGDEVEDDDLGCESRLGHDEKQSPGEDEVAAMAQEFAAMVPADEFSPAEVQGYLLRHKRSPRDAVDNIGPWVEEMRKQRKKNGAAQPEDVSFDERRDEPKADQNTPDSDSKGDAAEDAKGQHESSTDEKNGESSRPELGADTPSSGDSVVSEPRTPADVGPILPSSTKDRERGSETLVGDN